MRFLKTLAISVLASASATTFAAGEVSLSSAQYYMNGTSCDVCNGLEAVIEVANIGYEKEVTLHHLEPFQGSWTAVDAEYVGPSREGYEYWKVSKTVFGDATSFAIEYEVNGQTYWDNNNGSDYYIASDDVILSDGVNVLLNRAEGLIMQRFPSNVGVLASVTVRNIAYEKDVKVRYTTDNWLTINEVSASYAQTDESGFERWAFSLELPVDATDMELVVSYTVNGVTYWDNNLGRNHYYILP